MLKVQKRFPLKLKRFLKDKLAVRLLYCLNPLAPASTLWCVCCCVVAVLGVFNHRFHLITTVKFNVDFYLTIFVIRLKPIFISGYNREILCLFFFFAFFLHHPSLKSSKDQYCELRCDPKCLVSFRPCGAHVVIYKFQVSYIH